MDRYLDVVSELVCLNDPESYAGGSFMLLYSILVVIVCSLELSATVYTFIQYDQASSTVTASFERALASYVDDETSKEAVDKIQRQFSCCGVEKPWDWLPTSNGSAVAVVQSEKSIMTFDLPSSCCLKRSSEQQGRCSSASPASFFQQPSLTFVCCDTVFLAVRLDGASTGNYDGINNGKQLQDCPMKRHPKERRERLCRYKQRVVSRKLWTGSGGFYWCPAGQASLLPVLSSSSSSCCCWWWWWWCSTVLVVVVVLAAAAVVVAVVVAAAAAAVVIVVVVVVVAVVVVVG
ncbi:tetraspanin [Elysia marginata]|uniref:Tetraspanin n=1 Tax=Elysia marginata TaxID=1093978 RepID=A0AAV4ILI1_9GAST|nr:tetraspanin [Elysia marginata]